VTLGIPVKEPHGGLAVRLFFLCDRRRASGK
jgi:hypothetical protein